MQNKTLNHTTNDNFKNLKWWTLLPGFLALIYVAFLVFTTKGNFVEAYVGVQKDWFFYLNEKLSIFPNFQFNITQLGDVLIVFPFVMFLVRYAPRFWGALPTSSLLSLGVSAGLKRFFSVPRPAGMFDNESFTIIGRTLTKHSLPSGHSMTIFILITLLLFAFMPRKNKIYQFIWTAFILSVGLMIAFSRVGVGAHYPLDVVTGSAIGYILAIIGIKINNNVNWWDWVGKRKFLPIFILLFAAWGIAIGIVKLPKYQLPIFYMSIVSIIIALYLIIKKYVQKKIN